MAGLCYLFHSFTCVHHHQRFQGCVETHTCGIRNINLPVINLIDDAAPHIRQFR